MPAAQSNQSHPLDAELREHARRIGVDSLGVASVDDYSARVPNDQKPEFLAAGMRSIVVFTKHLLTGAVALDDVATQSLCSHLGVDAVDEATFRLAEWLVKHVRTAGSHRVEFLGPPVDRDPEYMRDRDFDALVSLGARPVGAEPQLRH